MQSTGKKPLFSLIVPTYNESGNILVLLDQVHAALGPIEHEVLVVDDNSPDGTAAKVTDYGQSHPWARSIVRTTDRGLSSAVLEGFRQAKGDILGVMDADLSHDEGILPQLIAAIQSGAQLAVGSRRLPGGGATDWPWYRRLSSSLATLSAKLLLDLRLTDPMSGYFVLQRSLYEACAHRLAPRGYKILVELYCKGRPQKVAEVPFIFRNRKEGYSKLTNAVARQYLEMLFILRFDELLQKVRYRYHTGRYKKVRQELGPGTLLDIGCGQPCETMPDGAFLRFMGYGTGVDIKPMSGPFTFVQGSVLELPFADQSFDNIVAMEVLEHVTEPHRAFREISRVLKDGGRVVVSVPRENWLWGKIWHVWEHTFGYMWAHTHTGTQEPEKWLAILREHFAIENERRHWHFDMIFRLSKRPAHVPAK